MTKEEHDNLKEGDQLIRIEGGGNSHIGFITTVFYFAHGAGERPLIKHASGSTDFIVKEYWNLYKKVEPKKSGFAKFIKRVEEK